MASAASIEAVQQAYIAYYGRPADPAGLDFWASRLDDEGGDITSMIQAFGTSTEATELYGSGALNVTRAVTAIDNIYNQVFGRDADDEGESFYVTKLLSGEFTFVDVAQRVLDGATGTDAALIANKTLAAQSFTDALAADDVAAAGYVGTAAAQGAKTWLAQVDETLDSVVAAEANLTETVQANGDYTYTYAEAAALYASDTLPANFSISDESVDLGTLSILELQEADDEAGAILALAVNGADLADSVVYALEDEVIDGGVGTVAAATATLARIQVAKAGASNGDDVEISLTGTLSDTYANLVAADADVLAAASSITLTDESLTAAAVTSTVAGLADAQAAAVAAVRADSIVDRATNGDTITVADGGYSLADSLANLSASDAVDAASSITLTDESLTAAAVTSTVAGLADAQAAAVAAVRADSIVDRATNGDTITVVDGGYAISDTLANLVAADADVLAGVVVTVTPASISVDIGAVTVAGQAAAVASAEAFTAAEQAILDSLQTSNGASVTREASYTYADTLANIVAAGTLDASYALTDDADLGGLSTAEITVLLDATNATDFTYGSVATLTTSTDTIQLTANSDTIDGSTRNSLQSADLILDSSTSDSDVLNATVTSTADTPRITNVETINLTAAFTGGGLALTNVTGASEINIDSTRGNGSMSLTNVSSVSVGEINAGSNLTGLAVTSLSSGTRDYVTLNLGGASGSVTAVTGGADLYNISIGAGNANLVAFGANDDVILSNDGTSSISLAGSSALQTMTINASGDLTINVTTGLASATTVNSDGTVTIDLGSGAASMLSDMTITNGGADSIVVNAGSAIDTMDFENIAVDYIVFNDGSSESALVDIQINSGSILQLGTDLGTALLVSVGTGSATGQTAQVELAASQTGLFGTTDNVEVMSISSVTGSTVTLANLQVTGSTTTIIFDGANDITVADLTGTSGTTLIVEASTMTGDLSVGNTTANATFYLGSGDDSVSSEMTFTVYAGAGDDIITGSAATIYGEAGDDTITLTAGANTVYGGDGADTITGAAGLDTIFAGSGNDVVTLSLGSDVVGLGAGTDEVRMATTATTTTISDFVFGEDFLVLTGAGGSAVDVSTLSVSTALYTFGSATITLTGNTETDGTDSVQLGRTNAATYDVSLTGTAATVVAGDFGDHITVNGTNTAGATTVTLGDGADTLYVSMVYADGDATDATAVQVLDFNVAEDVIVLRGGTDGFNIDVGSVTVTSSNYEFGSGNLIKLTGVTDDDLSAFVQFGVSSSSTFAVSSSTVILGDLSDFINIATSAAATSTVVSWRDPVDGNVDYINFGSSSATLAVFNFDNLTDIGATATDVAVSGTVTDAIDGMVYVFASGNNNISFGSSATLSPLSTSFELADVATYLDTALGSTSGEKYVAIINDASGDAAYIYYVDVTGENITEDMLTQFAIVDGLGSGQLTAAIVQ